MEKIETIRNEAEYETALARISDLMDALSGPQGQITEESHPDRVELDSLFSQVECYEDKHYVIDPPSAIEAIEFYIDQTSMTLHNPISSRGNRARVSEESSGRWDWQTSLDPAVNSVMRRVPTTRKRISTAA